MKLILIYLSRSGMVDPLASDLEESKIKLLRDRYISTVLKFLGNMFFFLDLSKKMLHFIWYGYSLVLGGEGDIHISDGFDVFTKTAFSRKFQEFTPELGLRIIKTVYLPYYHGFKCLRPFNLPSSIEEIVNLSFQDLPASADFSRLCIEISLLGPHLNVFILTWIYTSAFFIQKSSDLTQNRTYENMPIKQFLLAHDLVTKTTINRSRPLFDFPPLTWPHMEYRRSPTLTGAAYSSDIVGDGPTAPDGDGPSI